jgi:hypothetical protein
MILILYSDKNCEHQAISCIRSLTNKITPDVKIVYYTIGFKTEFSFKNLHAIQMQYNPTYPRFHYYKAELSLFTMDIFPGEDYAFTDTDVLFSSNFDFNKVKHDESYPLACYGAFEYPFMWEERDGVKEIFDETRLMKYCNVPERSQRYVWSCFYSFSEKCRDFFEEYTSFCKNKYLLDRQSRYFPYADETPFNICLWKRGATKNLGFAFVNTHRLDTIKQVEEAKITAKYGGNSYDAFGTDWEYIHDSKEVLLYHGFKEKNDMEEAVDYLLKIQQSE